ncbi:uncharacterized protein L203_102904 [Cryptococcus depauperatus CBS 7841]|uniref:Uncharacterized protein n=1 Tax=Cryptococcus depauperatus CBS 7841 TaxID=1295531 RepID=A0AAJ8M087_9TREE
MALVLPAHAVVFSQANARMTFYYDIKQGTYPGSCGSTPGDPVAADWATGINGGVPFCERARGYSLSKLGTNRIVAFNSAMVAANPAYWCGREVQIYNADGSKFQFAEGSFYIWDGCDACRDTNSMIIDASAAAFVQMKGGTCAGNNPEGLRYEVLDNYLVDPSEGLGAGAAKQTGSGTSQGAVVTGSTPVVTSVPISTQTTLTSGPVNNMKAVLTSNTDTTNDGLVTTSTTLVTVYVDPNSQSNINSQPTNSKDNFVNHAVQTPHTTASSSDHSGAETTTVSDDCDTDTSISPSPTDTSSGGLCKYGAWQCDGLTLQVCNYISITTLDWETIETCGSVCQITNSGSVDCQ